VDPSIGRDFSGQNGRQPTEGAVVSDNPGSLRAIPSPRISYDKVLEPAQEQNPFEPMPFV
jgi:hypothetical protein